MDDGSKNFVWNPTACQLNQTFCAIVCVLVLAHIFLIRNSFIHSVTLAIYSVIFFATSILLAFFLTNNGITK